MSSDTTDMTTTARSSRPACGPVTITRTTPQAYYAPLARMAWITTKILDPIHGVQTITQRVKLA